MSFPTNCAVSEAREEVNNCMAMLDVEVLRAYKPENFSLIISGIFNICDRCGDILTIVGTGESMQRNSKPFFLDLKFDAAANR